MTGGRALQNRVEEAYRRNASADRKNLGAGGTIGGVEARYAAYKILSQILFCRLVPIATNFVGSYHAGFVGGIFTLRQILQKCRERQVATHHLFIDFKAAYGTIDRKELWSIMQRSHFPREIDPTVRGHHERAAVQGESIELDI